MKFLKSTFLPFLGLTVLLFFIAMSYFHSSLFLDKLIVCSFILGMVFFAKIRSESNNSYSNTDNTRYADQIKMNINFGIHTDMDLTKKYYKIKNES